MKQKESRRLAGGRDTDGANLRTEVHSPLIIPRDTPNASEPEAADASNVGLFAAHAPKLLYTVGEAAELLSLSRAHLYRLLQRGELASVSSGRTRRISHAALVAYVAGLEQEAQP